MAASGPSAGVTTGIVLLSFLCLGLILCAVVATIILSLISIYGPNRSQAGFGAEYLINSILLKTLHTNTSAIYFKNGSVADSTALSALCGTVYRTTGATSFAGCVAKNFRAYGPFNGSTTSKRRRRAADDIGVYQHGQASIYYSSSCESKGDRLKYSTSSQLSSCAKRRLAECNKLANGGGSFTAWTPLPSAFTLSIVDLLTNSYVAITINQLFGIPFSLASGLATTLGLSAQAQTDFTNGCQYIAPASQETITGALASQASATTTLPTTTNAVG